MLALLLARSTLACIAVSARVAPSLPLAAVRAQSFMAAKETFRNPHNLPVKDCVVCGRPFTWRKKWENCWDEVTTCSKKCNSERKKANRAASGSDTSEGSDADDAQSRDDQSGGKATRKAAKKAAKAERRARREGVSMSGQKACDLCEREVDLLIRCQIDSAKAWKMVCGRCWKTPAVANGVVDGDGTNPHYRYGGLWKNLHRAKAS